MDLLDHIELVYTGNIVGDIATIIANAKQILSVSYFQDIIKIFHLKTDVLRKLS